MQVPSYGLGLLYFAGPMAPQSRNLCRSANRVLVFRPVGPDLPGQACGGNDVAGADFKPGAF
jgi:hypothetical protein